MEPHCNQLFPNVNIFIQLLVWITTWHTDVTGAASNHYRGEVGGNVTFGCPVHKQRTLALLYIQKGDTFVNGYYATQNVSGAWDNTRVDLDKTTVFMYNLKPSHDGDYQCIIQYSDQKKIEHVQLHLTVTANYSRPTLTGHCSDTTHSSSCLVRCASHGGFPDSEVTWHAPGSLKVMNNSKMRDPDTTTFNISNAAYVNCSDFPPTSLRCSVGNVMSDVFSVCTPKDPPGHGLSVIIAAICAAGVGLCIMVALLWRCCCKKGKRKAECAENGCEEEETALDGNLKAF
ncbi:T-lymphocyte activation antigen CD80 isoform X1 [Pungitius pungitius]|uniref:T-lymphocyte activation antigen CD80 isoform X1 n=1 Tax=Pungitius pungitius TaxID=134920 RepID=UPI002E157666